MQEITNKTVLVVSEEEAAEVKAALALRPNLEAAIGSFEAMLSTGEIVDFTAFYQRLIKVRALPTYTIRIRSEKKVYLEVQLISRQVAEDLFAELRQEDLEEPRMMELWYGSQLLDHKTISLTVAQRLWNRMLPSGAYIRKPNR